MKCDICESSKEPILDYYALVCRDCKDNRWNDVLKEMNKWRRVK